MFARWLPFEPTRAKREVLRVSRMMTPSCVRYPLYEASGSPLSLGRQHGDLARLKIRSFVGYLCEILKLKEAELGQRAKRFRPLFERHCPKLLEEIRGVAEGADIPFELALAAQLRGELGQLAEGACTTFVIGPRGTADGSTLIGQTSDMAADMRDFCYLLRLIPDDRPELLMWTFGGQIGYHGLNSHGVAHFANSLGGGPSWRFALSHYPLKRLILEQTNLTAARQLMREFPVCSNGNYVLCDGTGSIADVELTSTGAHFLDDAGAGFLAHANHYLCKAHACEANFQQSLPDSFSRQARMQELLKAGFGSHTVASLKSILSDHNGHPVSICRHPHDGTDNPMLPKTGHTVAAMIAEPNHGRLHLAAGNPCVVPFQEYSLTRGVRSATKSTSDS